ncbi:hypothetical protein TRIP_C60576 [Candidatus Zixiibacteriota bacterium]|nr:hypothetical protein TRIP_C60576 [candidate division Zixibacteria bacterium]
MIKLVDFIKVILSEFPEDRLTYQKGIPTFHPESASEAAQLFVLANRYEFPLFITGFGNQIDPMGRKFEGLVTIRTDRMNTMFRIVPDDFYIIVGSGFPLREINRELKEFNLFLPHSGLPYVGSVGGALAAGLSAYQNEHVLPLSRYFLMAEIATPEGEIIKPGSACFKSVSGYDIVKIFSPSWGLLGLIAVATLRVLPLSLQEEYQNLKMLPFEYRKFLKLYQRPDDDVASGYSLKIKRKFDPKQILPLIDTFN